MAAFDGMDYESRSLTLEAHDELLLYTDGINEAMDVSGERYGNDRLEAFLRDHASLSPHELNDELLRSVMSWSKGAEQSDDITILALEFFGAKRRQ